MKAVIDRSVWDEAYLQDAQAEVKETAIGIRESIIGVLLGFGGQIPSPIPGKPNRQPSSRPGNPPHIQTGYLLISPKIRNFKYVAHINMEDYALPLDEGHGNVAPRPYLDQAIEGYLTNTA
jgi:hypothetical protein